MKPRVAPSKTGQPERDLAIDDLLADSFPLLPGEAEWLIQLLGSELGRCIDDHFQDRPRLHKGID